MTRAEVAAAARAAYWRTCARMNDARAVLVAARVQAPCSEHVDGLVVALQDLEVAFRAADAAIARLEESVSE